MSDIKVCRICVRTDVKMYKFNQYQLKSYYEEIMTIKVNDSDGLPQYFCYECAAILHKYHKFKEKCHSGQKLLKELLWSGPITYELVNTIESKDMPKHPLSVSSFNSVVHSDCANIHKDSTQLWSVENINKCNEPKDNQIIHYYHSDNSYSDNESVNQIEKKYIIPIDVCETKCSSPEVKSPVADVIGVKCLNPDDLAVKIDFVEIKCSISDNTSETNSNISNKTVKRNRRHIRKHNLRESIRKRPVSNDQRQRTRLKRKRPINDICETKRKGKRKPTNNIKLDKANTEIDEEQYIVLKVDGLDLKNWKIIQMDEEEAMRDFKSKAEDSKYMAAAFKCTDCVKWYTKKIMLDRHRELRHAESLGRFICHFCSMRYDMECNLRIHMRQHYQKYQCLRCDLVTNLHTTAALHEEKHDGVIRTCPHCDQHFRHLSTYYTHMRTHRSEHVCYVCGASFVSAMGLKQHTKLKHMMIEQESADEDADLSTYCDRCDITFETRKAYTEHIFHSTLHENDTKSSEVAPKDHKKILGKRIKAKIIKQVNGLEEADEKAIRKVGRQNKQYRKRTPKPMSCYQCGQQFETQSACWRHHLAEHPRTSFYPPGERYFCEICGAIIAPGSVPMHRNMHSRDKLFGCDVCGRQFHSNVGLRRHAVTHTGEKPYACPLCEKRFTQSNSMKLHYKTFHLKQPYPKRNRRSKKIPDESNPNQDEVLVKRLKPNRKIDEQLEDMFLTLP